MAPSGFGAKISYFFKHRLVATQNVRLDERNSINIITTLSVWLVFEIIEVKVEGHAHRIIVLNTDI